jgi:hypothetical protein
MYLAKWRPVARANEIRLPCRSVTFMLNAIFPSVACREEDCSGLALAGDLALRRLENSGQLVGGVGFKN